jgi:hypothetical protein
VLWLNDVDPWALRWPEEPFTLLALRGFRPQPQTISFASAVSQIKQFADEGQPSAAYRALHTLPLVDLYDVADELAMRDRDEGGTNVVMSLVNNFKGSPFKRWKRRAAIQLRGCCRHSKLCAYPLINPLSMSSAAGPSTWTRL